MRSQVSSRHPVEVFKRAVLFSKQYGVAEQKIKLLLADLTNSTLPSLFLSNELLSSEQEEVFNQNLQLLIKHIPLQYIIGKTDFYGLTLKVNENVLIPRPETEGLVEWIISEHKENQRILDIGTGSGAIALALKHLNPAFKVCATDISHQALKLARFNANNLGLKINFIQTDLFPPRGKLFDILVSNPPYITTAEYIALDDEVLLYEPKLALYAGKDGLSVYRQILRKAKKYMQSKGKIFFEIGESQAGLISDIAIASGFNEVEMRRDLTGRDRYLCISG